jgi:hypothetical protein
LGSIAIKSSAAINVVSGIEIGKCCAVNLPYAAIRLHNQYHSPAEEAMRLRKRLRCGLPAAVRWRCGREALR